MPIAPKIPHNVRDLNDWAGINDGAILKRNGNTVIGIDALGFTPINSPVFTGIPSAPTAAIGTNNTQIATTAFIKNAIDALIAGAPGALDTLKEIADQLSNDESALSALTIIVAAKLSKSANLSDLTDIGAAKLNLNLNNLDNTRDANKPVSIAQAAANTEIQAYAVQRANHTGTQNINTITGLGTGIQTALGVNLGTSGAVVTEGSSSTLNLLTVNRSGAAVAYTNLVEIKRGGNTVFSVRDDGFTQLANELFIANGSIYASVNGVTIPTGGSFKWTNDSTGYSSANVGISHPSSATLKVTDGSTGYGNLELGNLAVTGTSALTGNVTIEGTVNGVTISTSTLSGTNTGDQDLSTYSSIGLTSGLAIALS